MPLGQLFKICRCFLRFQFPDAPRPRLGLRARWLCLTAPGTSRGPAAIIHDAVGENGEERARGGALPLTLDRIWSIYASTWSQAPLSLRACPSAAGVDYSQRQGAPPAGLVHSAVPLRHDASLFSRACSLPYSAGRRRPPPSRPPLYIILYHYSRPPPSRPPPRAKPKGAPEATLATRCASLAGLECGGQSMYRLPPRAAACRAASAPVGHARISRGTAHAMAVKSTRRQ